MEEYYQNKRDKIKDFIIGFLINIGIGIATSTFYSALLSINIPFGLITFISIILVVIAEYILIKKHLKTRRYIAIGMISAIIIPLLVFGTCSVLIFSL